MSPRARNTEKRLIKRKGEKRKRTKDRDERNREAYKKVRDALNRIRMRSS